LVRAAGKEAAAGALAPYRPAWLFCFAMSAIVSPFAAGEPVFLTPLPASSEAKASPPAGFLAAALLPMLAVGETMPAAGDVTDDGCWTWTEVK